MRVHLLNESKQQLGGGWTFIHNFKKGAITVDGIDFVPDWKSADIVLIPASSMVTKETVAEIRNADIPYVLRIDNIPRNSRNRNTGSARLFNFAQHASEVVYQSNWARNYLGPFVKNWGRVIYNGVDTTIFSQEGNKVGFDGDPVYIYSRFNRDETKSWERAWYRYQMIQRGNPQARLVIVGQFSDELIDCDFDFFMGERYTYLGIVDDPIRMADILRGCNVLLAPYYNDAYSNTIQEALACGLDVEYDLSGGTSELIKNGPRPLEEMVEKYLQVFKEVLAKGGEIMDDENKDSTDGDESTDDGDSSTPATE